MQSLKTAMLAGVALVFAGVIQSEAKAQPAGNMDKLQDFKTTGAGDLPLIPQTGAKADAVKRNLAKVKLPQGFKIELYALVPDARAIAVGPQGVVTFVGTRKSQVYAVTDRAKMGVAEEVKPFAPTIQMSVPNGVCFSKDGVLHVVERNRVLAFPAAEFFYEGADIAVAEVVKQGELIPKSEESFNHTARICRIGPDDKLYVALGQPFNVPAAAKMDMYRQKGIGGIVRMTREGKDREVFATGIRNSVGMDFNPKDGALWFTDNQVDGMGDDIPPGEINRADKPGLNFGFPWYGGGKVRTAEYKNQNPPADVVFPQAEMDAHAADLGMIVYGGQAFPEKYRGGIFSAQHGSWNRTKPIGARVMFTPIKADGSADKPEVFAEGWLTENGEYLGRPVDVATLRDGSLLVSDDFVGALYRISYQGQ